MNRPRWHFLLATLAALGVLLLGLRGALSTFSSGIWGPSDPWLNGDFNGSWWLWWAFSEQWSGTSWWQSVHWPQGMASLAAFFPNPGDMAILGAIGPPTALKWNLVQLVHLGGMLAATVALARALGASALASAAGAALVAGSPIILHEVAGGRPSNLVVWPGVLALAALVQKRSVTAGLLGALQFVAYVWHGVALLLLALPLVQDRKLGLKALGVLSVAILPYLAWLVFNLGGVPMESPPDGYTSAPLAGLLGLDMVPPRFRVHPLLLPLGLVFGWRSERRLLCAVVLGVLVALGPAPTWAMGSSFMPGVMALLNQVSPPLNRMHHPVRVMLLVLPVLAVLVALGVDRVRGRVPVAVGVFFLSLATGKWMDQGSTYAQPIQPPYADLEVPGEGPVADPLGARHLTALSLQPFHRRAIVQGPGSAGGESRAEEGVEYTLLLLRFPDQAAESAAFEAGLGQELSPGVYQSSLR